MKVKRKYFILKKKNKRLLKLINNHEIKILFTRSRKFIKINKNFIMKISKLKQQHLTINLKLTNLNIYNYKNLKEFKN